MKPCLIIHGGACARAAKGKRRTEIEESLQNILRQAYKILERGGSAVDAVVKAASLLEDDPIFNAGRGSKLQADGKIRMSAALMDGKKLHFSGVVNVEGLRHPIQLAKNLAGKDNRVLCGLGAKTYAKKIGLEFRSPYTEERELEFKRARKGKTGTIGAVAIDKKGRIAAATSTGGRGMEIPGRVSDSPTVAGNYANQFAGISATGIGEEIVDFALCAKIATRVEDGLSFEKAFGKSFQEARRKGFLFGAVGLGKDGTFAALTTTQFMSWAVKNSTLEKICPS